MWRFKKALHIFGIIMHSTVFTQPMASFAYSSLSVCISILHLGTFNPSACAQPKTFLWFLHNQIKLSLSDKIEYKF